MAVFDKAIRLVLRPKPYEIGPAAVVAATIGVGAGLMYVLDPDRGARRRALLRDRTVGAAHRTGAALDRRARDLGHRGRGVIASAASVFRHEEVFDEVLVDRVRSKLGRVVSNPHAIGVQVVDGRVTLTGTILEREVPDLLSAISAVGGVKGMNNQLEAHSSADGIPSLQGARAPAGEQPALTKAGRLPIARVLVAALGVGLVSCAVARRDRLGLLLGASGAAALFGNVAGRPIARLLGVGAGRRAVELEKAITVRAPVEEVFAFFIDFENFPRFMSHLRDVELEGDGRLRWTAVGPAGIPVRWEADVTEMVPNELIAWRSVPGAAVATAGTVRFEATPDGGTRLDIKMSYTPPAGVLGHAVAALFGVDPKHAMDDDLLRFRSLLENGKATAHGETVFLGDLAGQGGSGAR
ncbi:SRPBCC family protein [Sorangium sp. So ce131]|uniref:SRPBCC family protein n=1 Tax=Sorangium sp. So ce131 TaxID=3133282 RepID=UPI003F5ED891